MSEQDTFYPIFIKIPSENIAQLKFTLESYEGIGILRTLNKSTGELVILSLKDTKQHVEKVLEELALEFPITRLEIPSEFPADWLEENPDLGVELLLK